MRGITTPLFFAAFIYPRFLLQHVLATEICVECRSVELQNAPGVGFHLAMGYGTAAIRLLDGTLVDVVKVDGLPAYVAAIKELAEDAANVRTGKESTLQRLDYHEPPREIRWLPILDSLPKLPSLIKQQFQQVFLTNPDYNTAASNDPWVLAVAEMIKSLKTAVESRHPLTYNTVFLSLPNLVVNTGSNYEDRFRLSARHVGLSTVGGHHVLAAHAAMKEYYGIFHCPDIPIDEIHSVPDIECEKHNGERITNVLSIDYSGQSLGLILLPREDGFFFPDRSRLVERADLGAESSLRSQEPETYWARVKELVVEYSHFPGHDVDRLLLVGDRVSDSDFLAVVKDVFQSNEKVKVVDYLREPADHLFASARFAAREARVGMMTGFDACIWPDWCPVGEEKLPRELQWEFPKKGGEGGEEGTVQKEEL